MDTEELETRVRSLDDRLRTIEDVQEIENIQRMYGYYLEYGTWDEVVDLFSDNAESSIEISTSGVFLGKAGVESVGKLIETHKVPDEATLRGDLYGMVIPRIMFMVIKIGQPVIDVDPGGKTAYGRWAGLEMLARPMGGTWVQYWGHGIYDNEFIKEDGRWRFKKLHWWLTFHAPYEDGWLEPPTKIYYTNWVHPTLPALEPDRPSTGCHLYPDPEWCTVPFHYKHPLTAK